MCVCVIVAVLLSTCVNLGSFDDATSWNSISGRQFKKERKKKRRHCSSKGGLFGLMKNNRREMKRDYSHFINNNLTPPFRVQGLCVGGDDGDFLSWEDADFIASKQTQSLKKEKKVCTVRLHISHNFTRLLLCKSIFIVGLKVNCIIKGDRWWRMQNKTKIK